MAAGNCGSASCERPGQFTAAAASKRAALSRHGVTDATGYAPTRAGTQIWLIAARHATRGRYTLRLTTHRGHRTIHNRFQVTIA